MFTQAIEAMKTQTENTLSEDTYHLLLAVAREELEKVYAEQVYAALIDAHKALSYSSSTFNYARGAADAFLTAANIAKEKILNV